ncbi:MAG: hypothetical protein M1835_000623 [Candelina submexicana]|nr:MAG: hypothetical protein M1835_000623 [Candelina submexicana]
MYSLFLITVLLLSSSTFSFPATDVLGVSEQLDLHKRCGHVGNFETYTTSDWNAHGLNDWLDAWWNNHSSEIQSMPNGFAGAFGKWAIGNPDWSCRDDGSDSNCDFTICDNPVLNNKGHSVRQTYYVLESIQKLHYYFKALRESFEVGAIGAALSKDAWAFTFYHDKDDKKDATVLKEVLNVLSTVVGFAAAFSGLAGTGLGVAGGAAGAIFTGAVGVGSPLIKAHQDNTFQTSAEIGGILGKIVVDSLEGFTAANDQLMKGENYQGTGDIRTYLKDGAFLTYAGADKVATTNMLNNFLIGTAINALYKNQSLLWEAAAVGTERALAVVLKKLFFVVTGEHGTSTTGTPKLAAFTEEDAHSRCRQENDAPVSTTSHQWGWVNPPKGMDQLGKGDYAGIKVQDIISSSLDSYNVAGYSYTADTAHDRALSALRDHWRNPGDQGPSWEGTFTIPVCDVSWAINNKVERKEWILQPYGHDSRPNWCGHICGGDAQKTKEFIQAANMNGFKSPTYLCSNHP